jgi:CheY-like chemotaxis protein
MDHPTDSAAEPCHRLLLADAEHAQIRQLLAPFGNEYAVTAVASAELALEMIAGHPAYDVLLLGQHLPDMEGLELVNRLREQNAAQDAAMVFLAEQDSVENRLAAYDAGAGGYDFKPLSGPALHGQIQRLLQQRQAMAEAKQYAGIATNVALSAMGEMGSLGRINQLFRGLFRVKTLEEIPPLVFEALSELGMECLLQLSRGEEVVSASSQGECSDMDLGLFNTISLYGDRIYSYRSQSAVCYDHVILVAKNMPKDDPHAYGRLKDYLAMVADGLDERIRTL